MPRIAVVQRPPVFLDRAQTLERAAAAIREAAEAGAQLIVFPEAFISGYPAWIWRLRPGQDMALSEQLHSRLGDSVVVAPGGKIAAGPMHEEHGILYAEVDLERVGAARRSLDVVGHYARPDLFQLHVNTGALNPVTFTESSEEGES